MIANNNDDDNSSASITAMIESARVENRAVIMAYPSVQYLFCLTRLVQRFPQARTAVVTVGIPPEVDEFHSIIFEIDDIANEAKQEAVNGNFPLAVALASRMYEVVEAGCAVVHANRHLFRDYIESILQGLVNSPVAAVSSPEFAAVIQAFVDSLESCMAVRPPPFLLDREQGTFQYMEGQSVERIRELRGIQPLLANIVTEWESSNLPDDVKDSLYVCHLDPSLDLVLRLARAEWTQMSPADQAAAVAALEAAKLAKAAERAAFAAAAAAADGHLDNP